MRLRDTRMHCAFSESANPIVLRESCWREATFEALAAVTFFSLSPSPYPPTHSPTIKSTCMARCVYVWWVFITFIFLVSTLSEAVKIVSFLSVIIGMII